MNFLNVLLAFPGKIIANLLYDDLGLVWLIVLAIIIGLLAAHDRYKKREFFRIALIASSILLALTPSVFQFASYGSKLFWVLLFLSVAIGFVYYFIEKDNDLTVPAMGQENGQPVNVAPEHVSHEMRSFNRTTEGSVFYQNRYALLIALIFVLAFYLRTFKIEQFPAGYSFWELNTPLGVIEYDSGQYDFNHYLQLFRIRQVNFSNDSPVVMGLAVPFYKIFGVSLVTGRYFSVVWGMVGLLFLFLYLRALFPMEYSIFLLAFTALELVHVTFSRIGYFHITATAYSFFLLYLLERTFQQRRRFLSLLWAFFLGLALFGSIYVYHPAMAFLLIVILLLIYKILFRQGFWVKNRIPLGVFFITFSLAIYVYTQGNLRTLWPYYPGYLSLDPGTPIVEFLKEAWHTFQANFEITFHRIVFTERAVDSLSKFKEGGLILGPTLCFIPFAIGLTLAGIRRERNVSILAMIAVALLPPMLAGVPNASRLILFLSLLLILPGITVYLLFDQIQRVLDGRIKAFAVLIPALFFASLFSYHLYVFMDIHNNMAKKNSVAVPFAESGFMDKLYSRYTTAFAKEIREFTKGDNVFFYYSDIFHENPTAPNGMYEQFLIESYDNRKKGGKLVWMNPFYSASPGYRLPETPRLHSFEAALKRVLDSDRDIKVIFIKPLADERGIYEKLKAFFPRSTTEKRSGETDEDNGVILSILHSEIEPLNHGKDVSLQDKTLNTFSSETISRLMKENIKTDFSLDRFFLLENDSQMIFKNNVRGLFEITIDNYKLNKAIQDLSLLKGIHHVTIKPVDKEPFTVMHADPGQSPNFSAPFMTLSEAVQRNQTNVVEMYPHHWSLEKTIPLSRTYPMHSFYSIEGQHSLHARFYTLFDEFGQPVMPDDYRGGISRILQKDSNLYVLRYFRSMNHGYLTVYDSNRKTIKDMTLDGYPFDCFFVDNGNLYITYLNRDKITILKPEGVEETWDTSSFSEFPIWNGATDKNGDILLLSGAGQVFVFDRNRNPYHRFNVDASWTASVELIRSRGGMLMNKGILHVLDPVEDSIKSYDKRGHRLQGDIGNSLFRLPPDFKVDFMQGLKDTILLAGSAAGERRIHVFVEK